MALAVQFVKGIVEIILVLKLADVLVSLGQSFKNPLPSIPMQQVFVTEVRDEKVGISSQSSPQKYTVFLRGDISCAQPLFLVCDDSRASFSQDDYRPISGGGLLSKYFFGSLCHCDRDDHQSSSLPPADQDDH